MTRFALLHYSFYRRVLLTLFIITASTILAVSVVLYFSFTRQIERDITSISTAMINQTVNASDLVYRQILDVGGHLIEDRDVLNTMFGRAVDRLAEAATARYLTSLRAVYPFISSLAIYNGRNSRYLSTAGLTPASDAGFLQAVIRMPVEQYLVQTPRTIVFPQPDTRTPVEVISFIMRPHLYTYLPQTSFVVVNVDVGYLQGILRRLSWGRNESLVILTGQGLVLASTGGYPFLADLAGQPWVRAVLQSPASQGAFSSTLAASRSLVTYQKSPSFGWFFVALNPYRDYLPAVIRFRRITAIVALMLILVGAALSVWLARHIYNPVQSLLSRATEPLASAPSSPSGAPKLLNEFQVLSRAFEQYVHRVSDLEDTVGRGRALQERVLVQSSLLGIQQETDQFSRRSGTDLAALRGPCFAVILTRVDNYQRALEDLSGADRSAIHLAVADSLHRFLSNRFGGIVVLLDENEIATVVQLPSPAVPDALMMDLAEVSSSLRQHLRITVTSAIGEIVRSADMLRSSMVSARSMIQYRFFRRGRAILRGPDIAEQSSCFVAYPREVAQQIVECVNLNKEGGVQSGFDTFQRTIARANYYCAVSCCSQLMMDLIVQFSPVLERAGLLEGFREQALRLSALEHLDEVMGVAKSLCSEVVRELRGAPSSRKTDILQSVCDFVQGHYEDPGLNMPAIAETLRVSPGYANRVFREQRRETFHEYLNRTRMGKALSLLETTDLPMQEVSRKVGIQNTTYFFTLFKKRYGVTPARFRERPGSGEARQ